MIRSILFVCTGNTCRSPMAQGMFKKILQEKEKNYYRYNIQSAGISAIPGMKPTDEAIKVMLEYGIDISQYKSQPLEEDLVKEADLILVMASEHQEYIQIRYPFAQNKVFLVKEFSQRKYLNKVQKKDKKYDIVDPIGKPIDFYRIIANDLKVNLEKIADIIIKKNNN